jgi:hypothetical protein
LLRKYFLIVLTLSGIVLISGCTLAPPFNQLINGPSTSDKQPTKVAEINRTPQATFTPTPLPTPTNTPTPPPTATLTPKPTPTPKPTSTDTPTNTPSENDKDTDSSESANSSEKDEEVIVMSSPINTPQPKPVNTLPPPPPTKPPEPTATSAPKMDYQLAENFHSPSEANILSIIVAIQNHDGGWIPGLRVVGIDPNGLVTKSEPSADHDTGHSPSGSSVVKTGNTKFEPQPIAVYITGTWEFYLETVDGRQVSESFKLNISEENREWYFFRFQPL